MDEREREEHKRYIQSLTDEELIEETRKLEGKARKLEGKAIKLEQETRELEEQNAILERLIAVCEDEIAQYHKQFEQMAKDLGYKPFDHSIKLLKKNGEVFATAKERAQKWGMPEIDMIESMQSLKEKGVLNVRVASETREGEKVYATSLTRLGAEKPDLVGYVSAEEYELVRDSLNRYDGVLSSEPANKKYPGRNKPRRKKHIRNSNQRYG